MGQIGEIFALAGLHVDKASIAEYTTALETVGKQADELSTGMKAMMAGALAAPAVAIGAIGVAGVQIASQFQDAATTLQTLYGSADIAKEKFQWMTDFASKTPFQFQEIEEGGIKLKSYGMDIEQYGKTFGDTAAGMGKSFNQVIEAVADAQTGEFERLKELGIKAVQVTNQNIQSYASSGAQVGDTLFTYMDRSGQQMTQVVDRNNREMITNTLSAIWNDKYAGAMDARSKTLSGMMSNLKDNAAFFLSDLVGFNMQTMEVRAFSLMGALMQLGQVAMTVGNFFVNLPEGVKVFISVALGAVAGLSLLAAGFVAVGAILPLITTGMAALGITTTLALWPIVAIVAGIALLGTAIYEVSTDFKDFEGVGHSLSGVFSSIQGSLSGLVAGISGSLSGIGTYIGTILSEAQTQINQFMSTATFGVGLIWDKFNASLDGLRVYVARIIELIRIQWNDFINLFNNTTFLNIFTQAFTGLETTVSGVFTAISTLWTNFTSLFSAVISFTGLTASFTGLSTTITTTLGTLLTDFTTWGTNVISSVTTSIAGVVLAIVSGLTGIALPDLVTTFTTWIDDAKTAVSTEIGKVVDAIKTGLSNIKLPDIVTIFTNWLSDAETAVKNKISDILGDIISPFKGLSLPNPASIFDGWGSSAKTSVDNTMSGISKSISTGMPTSLTTPTVSGGYGGSGTGTGGGSSGGSGNTYSTGNKDLDKALGEAAGEILKKENYKNAGLDFMSSGLDPSKYIVTKEGGVIGIDPDTGKETYFVNGGKTAVNDMTSPKTVTTTDNKMVTMYGQTPNSDGSLNDRVAKIMNECFIKGGEFIIAQHGFVPKTVVGGEVLSDPAQKQLEKMKALTSTSDTAYMSEEIANRLKAKQLENESLGVIKEKTPEPSMLDSLWNFLFDTKALSPLINPDSQKGYQINSFLNSLSSGSSSGTQETNDAISKTKDYTKAVDDHKKATDILNISQETYSNILHDTNQKLGTSKQNLDTLDSTSLDNVTGQIKDTGTSANTSNEYMSVLGGDISGLNYLDLGDIINNLLHPGTSADTSSGHVETLGMGIVDLNGVPLTQVTANLLHPGTSADTSTGKVGDLHGGIGGLNGISLSSIINNLLHPGTSADTSKGKVGGLGTGIFGLNGISISTIISNLLHPGNSADTSNTRVGILGGGIFGLNSVSIATIVENLLHPGSSADTSSGKVSDLRDWITGLNNISLAGIESKLSNLVSDAQNAYTKVSDYVSNARNIINSAPTSASVIKATGDNTATQTGPIGIKTAPVTNNIKVNTINNNSDSPFSIHSFKTLALPLQ